MPVFAMQLSSMLQTLIRKSAAKETHCKHCYLLNIVTIDTFCYELIK